MSNLSNGSVYTLNDYSNKINQRIDDIKKNYYFIGCLLLEVNHQKLYLEEHYPDIAAYCEKVFHFKKTFTYDLMNVATKFRGSSIFEINERYKNYSFSKLIIMSRMNKHQLSLCKPEYTVELIRHIKKYSTDNPYDYGISNNSVHTENSKNDISIHSTDKPRTILLRLETDSGVQNFNSFFNCADFKFKKGYCYELSVVERSFDKF